MPHALDAAVREDLRRAGLASHGVLPRLLALLRRSPETHLTLADVADLAAKAGVAMPRAELSHHLETLARRGLLGRLPTTNGQLTFDTVPEPHVHLVYEDAGHIVDLHVSNETLLVMLRDALARRPAGVDVLVRFRREPGAAPD